MVARRAHFEMTDHAALPISNKFHFIQLCLPLFLRQEGELVCDNLSEEKTWDLLFTHFTRRDLTRVSIPNLGYKDLALAHEDILEKVPSSLLGQLVRLLYERYLALKNNSQPILVLSFPRLKTKEKDRLLSLVLETAHLNQLDFPFIEWIELRNRFQCGTDVD